MKTFQATTVYTIKRTITLQAANQHEALEAIVFAPCPVSETLVSVEDFREVPPHRKAA